MDFLLILETVVDVHVGYAVDNGGIDQAPPS
jgi:hypothetical protein